MVNTLLDSLATAIVLIPMLLLTGQLRSMEFGELGSYMFMLVWIAPCAFVIWRIWA